MVQLHKQFEWDFRESLRTHQWQYRGAMSFQRFDTWALVEMMWEGCGSDHAKSLTAHDIISLTGRFIRAIQTFFKGSFKNFTQM